jgi:metallo-beta-lactamase family protein
VEESKTVNDPTEACIIISASGMGTGGRVVHHLAQMLPKSIHTVILVGYQAIGTRGRSLIDGSEYVRIHGESIPVRAQIEQINSFSVHADASELIDWLGRATVKPRKVFVVHGESGAASEFASFLSEKLGWESVVPRDREIFVID